jgi:transcriptional antiterminator NusG
VRSRLRDKQKGHSVTTETTGQREWYVIHTYAGYENKVKQNLEHRIGSMGVADRIFQVVVPMEDQIEIKNGKRNTVQRKVFPGYVLVEMVMDDQSWFVVRNTPGVTGFVSSGTKPLPLQESEVRRILHLDEAVQEPTVTVSFKKGENIKIVDGPFTEFLGIVDDVMPERNKLKVLVTFFGRETPVELDFLQVEKL